MKNELGEYEAYNRSIERFVDKISITKTGRIGFNKSVDAKHDLKRYSHVILYWDKKGRSLAIEFVNEPTKNTQLKLLIDKRGFGLHLNASNFFQTYYIDINEIQGKYLYKRIPARQFGVDRNGFVFIIKLVK